MQVEREELDDIVHDLYGTREYELIGATRMMWPDRAVALVTLPDGTRAWAIDGGPLSRMPLTPWRLRARLKVYRRIIAETEALLELAGELHPPPPKRERDHDE